MVDTPTNNSLENNAERGKQVRDDLRKRLRAARIALSEEALADAAQALLPKVLATLTRRKTTTPLTRVAGYLAFQGEIDVSPVMQALRAKNITTYVPMLNGETLQFAPWSEHTPYTTNRFGIVEPEVPKQLWVSAEQLDVVLVPLVAFDNDGHRMGMGGGFYDKTFSHRRKSPAPPRLIGVAHEFQRVETVYPQWWDVTLDEIVTGGQ